MAPPVAIRVRGLEKRYGDRAAVAGIDLEVAEGEVLALLGPNGAGKTTTVEILEGYRPRDGGEVSVLGIDPGGAPRRLRERIGIVLQSTGIEPYLTVGEVVEMHRGYYPRPRPAAEVLAFAGMEGEAGTRVGRLSGGLRRRLDLALALAGDPELLFLDEPTTGFDPSARRGAWDAVRGLTGLGRTVLLTTHFMDEAQALADRVAVIADGRIVAQGRPADLVGAAAGATVIRFHLPPGIEPPADGLEAPPERLAGGAIELRTTRPTADLQRLTSWAIAQQLELDDLRVSRPSLEDVYLRLTGHAAPGDDVGRGPIMNDLRLAFRQVVYENRAFWRNPAAAFFTFAFPLILMVLFNLLFTEADAAAASAATRFYTPAIIAFAVVTACYTNVAMTVTDDRERGILKRVRGTPLPTWAFLLGRVLHAVVVAFLLVAIVAAFGALAYGVEFPLARLPQLLLNLGVGAAAFSALALAVSGLIPSANAAPAIVNASILPLMFVSNVFVRIEDGTLLAIVGGLFPVRPFAATLISIYDPGSAGPGFETGDLLAVAAWGIGGLVVASRLFTWEPRR